MNTSNLFVIANNLVETKSIYAMIKTWHPIFYES